MSFVCGAPRVLDDQSFTNIPPLPSHHHRGTTTAASTAAPPPTPTSPPRSLIPPLHPPPHPRLTPPHPTHPTALGRRSTCGGRTWATPLSGSRRNSMRTSASELAMESRSGRPPRTRRSAESASRDSRTSRAMLFAGRGMGAAGGSSGKVSVGPPRLCADCCAGASAACRRVSLLSPFLRSAQRVRSLGVHAGRRRTWSGQPAKWEGGRKYG